MTKYIWTDAEIENKIQEFCVDDYYFNPLIDDREFLDSTVECVQRLEAGDEENYADDFEEYINIAMWHYWIENSLSVNDKDIGEPE